MTAVLDVAVLGAGMEWLVASGGLGGLLETALSDAMDEVFTPAEEGAGPGAALETLVAGFFTALIVGIVVGAVVVALVTVFLIVTVFLGVTGLFMTVAYLRARRGERRTRAVALSPAEIERIARELPRHGPRPIGSRLTVLRSPTRSGRGSRPRASRRCPGRAHRRL